MVVLKSLQQYDISIGFEDSSALQTSAFGASPMLSIILSAPTFPVGEPQIILNYNGIVTANTSGKGNIL